MEMSFTGAVIQMDCLTGEKEKNLVHAEKLVSRAAACGAKLIVLPELFCTGYRAETQDAELAEPVPGPTIGWMQALAERHDAYLAAALIEKTEKGLYDTAVLAGPRGYLFTHRKIHLWGGETGRFLRGDTLQTADLPFARVGLLICYEIGFPEEARLLAQQGAQLLIYPSAFGRARAYAWDTASRSRALENGAYVLACNRCGKEKDTEFGGLSRIVAPDTSILAGAGDDGEAVICAQIDLAAVDRQRQAIPYLRDLDDRLHIHFL